MGCLFAVDLVGVGALDCEWFVLDFGFLWVWHNTASWRVWTVLRCSWVFRVGSGFAVGGGFCDQFCVGC